MRTLKVYLVNSKSQHVQVSRLDTKRAATFSNYSIQMEPTLAWMHADRCFAIVHGCATTMKNAKVGQWVYHIDEIALLFCPIKKSVTDFFVFRCPWLLPH